MSNKLKTVIITGVVVLLLAGAFLALKLTEKKDNSLDSSQSSSSTLLLYDKDPNSVLKVTVDNSSGGYTVNRLGENKYEVEGYDADKLPINNTVLSTVSANAASITAQSIVEENTEDFEKYGLTKPAASVKIEFNDSDKTVKELLIGGNSPKSGETYISFKGEKTVYTVSTASVSVFLQDKISFLSLICLSEPEQEDYPRVDYVTVDRSDLDYPVKVEYDPTSEDEDAESAAFSAAHIMVEPIFSYLDMGKCTDYTHGMFGLTAQSINKVSPTKEDLDAAGINKPLMTVTMKAEQDTYKLTIGSVYYTQDENGNKIESGYYGCFSGIDILYTFSLDSLPWLRQMPMDICSQMITAVNIYNIDTLEITAKGLSQVYTVLGKDKETMSVTLGDKPIDKDYFKTFYQFILKAPGEELCLTEPEGDPIAVITVNRKNSENAEKLEFYDIGNRKAAIVHNGKVSFCCRISYVDRLFENLKLMDKGESIVSNW